MEDDEIQQDMGFNRHEVNEQNEMDNDERESGGHEMDEDESEIAALLETRSSNILQEAC